MNTKIFYLYRDAANYKVPNEAVIDGVLTLDQQNIIRNCLFDEDNFIPQLVGLPEKTMIDLGYKPDDNLDHPFFELCSFEQTDEVPTVKLTPDALTSKFQAYKGHWTTVACNMRFRDGKEVERRRAALTILEQKAKKFLNVAVGTNYADMIWQHISKEVEAILFDSKRVENTGIYRDSDLASAIGAVLLKKLK